MASPSLPVTPPLKPKLPQPSPPPLTATTSSPSPSPSPAKLEIPKPTTASTPRLPPHTPSSDADVIHIPSYSRWFSWNNIHECELRFLPEFFDSRSRYKTPELYTYIRNSIIKQFRQNPTAKISFTDVRKTLVADVGSIRRVYDFLDAWGLINYSTSALSKPLKWEDRDSKSSPQAAQSDGGGASADSNALAKDTSKRVCSGCKSVCSIACFSCDKYDVTLCARCYVRGNYRVGLTSSDFRRVEISEEMKTDWSEKDTLQLLEAVMHYGDDWKKVAQHVGGRSEKDCITHFIKLPFGEEFAGYRDAGEIDNSFRQIKDHSNAESASDTCKRMRLTPLSDASNPIMAQAAFLSALVGVEVAEAAAQAAVTTLTDVEYGPSKISFGSLVRNVRQQDARVTSNGDCCLNALERACLDASSMLEKEELDVESAISRITEVQMKEIEDKIARFEELDLQVEKERQQLEQMKNLLFADQLSILNHRSCTSKTGERMEENVRSG